MVKYGMLTEKEKVMSHPDPLFDPDNAYEDDDMVIEHDPSDILFAEYLYDDHDDFYEDVENSGEVDWNDSYDDSMDGDAESAFGSCGWGVDEYYGHYESGDDY
jgi:hypothetical protein